jgi:hypothetical protein
MKKSFSLLKYVFYFTLIVIGLIIGIGIGHYYNLPITEALNIVDLATLVVTIFLAVYIPEVLDRKLQVKRDKKDLIEQRVMELQALHRKINIIVQSEEMLTHKEYLVINNTLDVIQKKLDTIATLLKYAELDVSLDKEIAIIKRLCLEYHKLLSNPTKENEAFQYPDDILSKEESVYGNIDKATCLLIFKISEA